MAKKLASYASAVLLSLTLAATWPASLASAQEDNAGAPQAAQNEGGGFDDWGWLGLLGLLGLAGLMRRDRDRHEHRGSTTSADRT